MTKRKEKFNRGEQEKIRVAFCVVVQMSIDQQWE